RQASGRSESFPSFRFVWPHPQGRQDDLPIPYLACALCAVFWRAAGFARRYGLPRADPCYFYEINGVITMTIPISRRTLLKGLVASGVYQLAASSSSAGLLHKHADAGWVKGKMSGAQALVETLIQEGTDCVFGIPGAQENELWDAMKSKGL